EQAEEVKKKFDRFRITRAPRTRAEAQKVLGRLDALAQEAIAAYQAVGKYESGEWGLAALVRIGDVTFYQGFKIKEIPAPREVLTLDRRSPELDVLLKYQDEIEKLV